MLVIVTKTKKSKRLSTRQPNKRWSLKQRFGSLTKGGRAELEGIAKKQLEEEFFQHWDRPPEKLGVFTDFPRICRNIKCFDDINGTLKVIEFEKVPKRSESFRKKSRSRSQKNILESPEGSPFLHKRSGHRPSVSKESEEEAEYVFEEASTKEMISTTEQQSKVDHMKKILLIFANKLHEYEEFELLDRYILKEIDINSDLSKNLKSFFDNHIKSDSRILSLLKLINQSVLAPPYITLRNKFAAVDLPITDVHLWLIEVIFRTKQIVVVHSKKARSNSTNQEDQFEFIWHLQITLDREAKSVLDVRLSITDLEMNEKMDKAKKKKITNIVEHHLYF